MRGMPPLPGRRQRRLLQADPQSGVREPPPGMPQLRPLCPSRSAQRRHIRPGAEWTPGLNPDEPQLLCRTRKKKSLCGPSTNRIPAGHESRNTMWTDYQRHRQSHNSPGASGVFTNGIIFSLLQPEVFGASSPSKIVSILYKRAGGLPLSFFHFQDLDIRLSSFVDSE